MSSASNGNFEKSCDVWSVASNLHPTVRCRPLTLSYESSKVVAPVSSGNPDLETTTQANDFRTVPLETLVRMKLNAFRRKDQVHLLDMISLGMIDESWLDRYPDHLRLRLKTLLDDPEG